MLRKKMWREFWQHKAQFFSILLLCFLSMFVYSGIYAEWKGMEYVASSYYEQSKLADAWLMGDVRDGRYLDEIAQVADYEARTRLVGSDANVTDSILDIYAVSAAEISSFIVMEGKPYSSTQEGIWLDHMYAQEHAKKVGDKMLITIQNEPQEVEIQGLIWHGEYVFALKDYSSMLPDHTTYGYAFMAKSAYPMLESLPYNQIVVKEVANTKDIKTILEDATNHLAIQVVDRNHHASYQTLQEEIDQHRSIGTLFPAVFLLIAMLTTLNTMNKIIVNQRTQIGTLKALGFTSRKLYMHYMSHIVVLCILGNIVGFIFGPILIPNMIYAMQKSMYDLPIWKGQIDSSVVLLVLYSCIACLLTCFYAIYKEIQPCAASSMRLKVRRMYGKQRLAQTKLWKHLSFYTQWNLRDMLRNKARSIMAIVGIMGCSGLMVCSLGLQNSIDHMLDWQYEKLHTYQQKLILKQDTSTQDMLALKHQVAGSSIMDTIITIETTEKKIVPLQVLEDTRFIKLDMDNPSIQLPSDGVVIAAKLADELQLSIGDELRWQSGKDWHTSKVAMIKRVPLSQGIIMQADYYKQLENYQPTAILTATHSIPENTCISNIQNRVSLQKDMDIMLDAMEVIIYVLILAAALLGIIVLYNFTSLSFFERTREMATLKVIGFPNQLVRKLTIAQNMQLAFIGICLGLPFGYAMLFFMAETLSEGMDLMVVITLNSYAIAIGTTFVITYGISMWMAKKTNRINMVSALKAVE